MMDFLNRVLNAQIVMTLLGLFTPTALLASGLIPAASWESVFMGCFTVFVGGGFLKEGLTAFANRSAT